MLHGLLWIALWVLTVLLLLVRYVRLREEREIEWRRVKRQHEAAEYLREKFGVHHEPKESDFIRP